MNSWPEPVQKFLLAVGLLSLIGAVIGYFFYELYIGHVAAGPDVEPVLPRKRNESESSGNDNDDSD